MGIGFAENGELVEFCDGDAAGGGAPEWLPDGALIYADFVNGNYWMNGAQKLITDIFDLDGMTLAARGLDHSNADSEVNPVFTAEALSVISGVTTTGLSQITKWDANVPSASLLFGPVISDMANPGLADNVINGLKRENPSLLSETDLAGVIVTAGLPAWLLGASPAVGTIGVTLFRPGGGLGFECQIYSQETQETGEVASGFLANSGSPLVIYAPFGHADTGRSNGDQEGLFAMELTIYEALSNAQIQALTA